MGDLAEIKEVQIHGCSVRRDLKNWYTFDLLSVEFFFQVNASPKTGFEAYGLMAMTRLLNIPEDEARGICNGCYKEIMAGKQHGYHYQ